MWVIYSLDIPPYVATVNYSNLTWKIYIDMNSPALRSHIRLFSFRLAYYFSETKEEINTYLYDIYFCYPAIRSHIRLFSFCSAYFISETKEEINTYTDNIYLQCPAIRTHSWLLNSCSLSTFSKSRQELLRRNVPRKPWVITPLKLRPADGSGARSYETTIFLEGRLADGSGARLDNTTIFLEVGLVISGSRSQRRSAKNHV